MIRNVIPRRSHACRSCETRFVSGSTYYSALCEDQRLDYCADCWKSKGDNSQHCYWKSSIAAKPEKSTTKSEKAFSLFQELPSDKVAERFILALYLAREKLISLKKEIKEGGQRHHIYESPHGEAWMISIINLTAADIKVLQQELSQQLQCKSISTTSSPI